MIMMIMIMMMTIMIIIIIIIIIMNATDDDVTLYIEPMQVVSDLMTLLSHTISTCDANLQSCFHPSFV